MNSRLVDRAGGAKIALIRSVRGHRPSRRGAAGPTCSNEEDERREKKDSGLVRGGGGKALSLDSHSSLRTSVGVVRSPP